MWKWVSLAACLGEVAVHSAPLSVSIARLDWAAAAAAFAAAGMAAGRFAAEVDPLGTAAPGTWNSPGRER